MMGWWSWGCWHWEGTLKFQWDFGWSSKFCAMEGPQFEIFGEIVAILWALQIRIGWESLNIRRTLSSSLYTQRARQKRFVLTCHPKFHVACSWSHLSTVFFVAFMDHDTQWRYMTLSWNRYILQIPVVANKRTKKMWHLVNWCVCKLHRSHWWYWCFFFGKCFTKPFFKWRQTIQAINYTFPFSTEPWWEKGLELMANLRRNQWKDPSFQRLVDLFYRVFS